MQMNKNALILDLTDTLPWLGIDRIDNAVRLLKKLFSEAEFKEETVFLSKGGKSQGRKTRYLISLKVRTRGCRPWRLSGSWRTRSGWLRDAAKLAALLMSDLLLS
jgi:hypothetical protein